MKILETCVQILPEIPFDFSQAATAHGWVELHPNYWDKENEQVERIQQLSDGSVVRLLINGNSFSELPEISIRTHHSKQLSADLQNEVKKIVAHMLRLNEDFSELYELAEKSGGNFTDMNQGFGRLLRSPTVFEDVVKTICTTNIQWAGTKRMIQELVASYGEPYDGDTDQKSFPVAQSIAQHSFDEFISKTNLGYRAEYIYLLARQVSEGELDLESFLNPEISTADLKKKLLAIKGIGNYAAATMLMLLGHYDEIPVDSVFREFVFNKYFKGKEVSEKRATKIYKNWGKWQGLAYWYDLINNN